MQPTRTPKGAARAVAIASLLVASTGAMGAGDDVTLMVKVRDFRNAHADFNLPGAASTGHVAGLVSSNLGNQGAPVLNGQGREVLVPALDSSGAPVAVPSGASSGEPVHQFTITERILIPEVSYAVQVELLGAAIGTSRYDAPVTTRIRVGDRYLMPFGDFGHPTTGNVNDVQDVTGWVNPDLANRRFVYTEQLAAGTPITVEARSWLRSGGSGRSDSNWYVYMDENTRDDSPQVGVLRDGDPVPGITGIRGQRSAAEYVADYVDPDTNTMRLADNQVIYLFELGSNHSSSSADFQDLVVLVTLADSVSYFEDETTREVGDRGPCPGMDLRYIPADEGAESDGTVADADSFGEWFTDRPSANASTLRRLTLAREEDGTYRFATDDYTPIDGELMGDEGAEHNRSFTFAAAATFDSTRCSGQFVEVASGADVWIFIDGTLAMDLGGTGGDKRLRLDLDRLDLTDGEHEMQIFYAQRLDAASPLEIRTNIRLRPVYSAKLPTVSAITD